ncbi:MAG TPA: DUF1592 domain-containing protein [Polyangia bacterium]|nr:DUF1592 domain-containing protein [Polyangia bacterium]
MRHSTPRPRMICVLLGAASLAAACTGQIRGGTPAGQTGQGAAGAGASSGSGGSSATGGGDVVGPAVLGGLAPEQVLASSMCKAPSPGRAPLRRLSNTEYRNTVGDLFAGVPSVTSLVAAATATFPPEPQSLGFRNSADYLTVPSLAAQAYLDAADQLSTAAAAATGFVTCAGGTQDAKCASDFIASFGKKVYRRPLAADDTARYTTLYNKAISSGYDFKTGIEWIIFSMLQSPQFLYRFELGGTAAATYTKPSPYELASRLSYLYWQSMPDATLFAAADAGQLETQAQIEAQARRLLADPKASRLVEYFDEWLELDAMQEMTRDATIYPNLDPQLPSLMEQETNAFVSDLLKSPTGSFDQLLTAPYTFANAELAKHYGLQGPTTASFVRVPTTGRSGILTQGMMIAHDKATRTSIVRRGEKIRTGVLCQNVPAPPPNVDISALEKTGTNLSQRQRLEQHRQQASCNSCHQLMDPLGVVFEGFDAVGRPRTVDEMGDAVDTHSTITLTQDANGDVADPVALGQLLAKSDQVRGCYVTNSFRFFYGREVEAPDACSMARLLVDFKGTSFNLTELLVSLTRTDAFLYRPLPEVTP